MLPLYYEPIKAFHREGPRGAGWSSLSYLANRKGDRYAFTQGYAHVVDKEMGFLLVFQESYTELE